MQAISQTNAVTEGCGGGVLCGAVETEHAFVPHKSGKRYSDYIVQWDDWDASDKAVPIRAPRVVAIRMLDECWESFKHAGNVPSISERLDCQRCMGLRSMLPPHPASAV